MQPSLFASSSPLNMMSSAFVSVPLLFATSSRSTPLCPQRRSSPRLPARCHASLNTVDDAPAPDTWVPASHMSAPSTWPSVMSIDDIMKVLPHRYPFLLIDRVIAFEPGKRAIAIKNVSINEPYFAGHFPHRPIMPGVLQIEALAQVAGIVMLQQPISDGKGDFFFGGVDRVKWRKPVIPGDTLVMEMTLNSYKPSFGIAKMSGKGYVDGKLAVEGIFTLAMVVHKN